MRNLSAATALLTTLVFIGGTSLAADAPIKLKIADSLPPSHIWSVEGAQFFMKRATELTAGQVTFEHYPTEQLGKAKDMLALTQSGVTDIGFVVPSYISDKLPLSAVPESPGLYATSCEGTHAYWKMVHGGILAKLEMDPANILPLMAWTHVPYQLGTKSVPLTNISDVKGLKIRTTAGVLDLAGRALGVAPVNMAAPEIRDSLERGTLDGMFVTFLSMPPYQLQTVLKYSTVGAPFGGFAGTYSINARKFQSLSAEVRAALTRAGEEATERLCKAIDAGEVQASVDAEKAGVHLVHLTAAQDSELRTLLKPLPTEWATALDSRHLAGTEVLKAFQAALVK